jgi:hypothetical protein
MQDLSFHQFEKNYDFKFEAHQSAYITPDELNKIESLISPNHTIEYVTHGAWSTHHVLEKILYKTGKADVTIATWAVTEKPLKKLHKLKTEGYIGELSGHFEEKIEKHHGKALGFAKMIFDNITYSKCHAKVMLVENPEWNISIVSSSNWTTNKRTEVGIINCSDMSVEFHKKWMKNQFL